MFLLFCFFVCLVFWFFVVVVVLVYSCPFFFSFSFLFFLFFFFFFFYRALKNGNKHGLSVILYHPNSALKALSNFVSRNQHTGLLWLSYPWFSSVTGLVFVVLSFGSVVAAAVVVVGGGGCGGGGGVHVCCCCVSSSF